MVAPRMPKILEKFESLPDDIKWYFSDLPALFNSFSWDVSISHAFSLVETGHNMTIYCGVVKLHKVDSSLAWTALENQHMTRSGFQELYETIFGQALPKKVTDKIAKSSRVRDKILHGKGASEADKRQAIMDVLVYVELYNSEVEKVAGFRPFGSLKGFKGRAKSLDLSTSRWILKGIGFTGLG